MTVCMLYFPKNSAALFAPQLCGFNRLIASDSKCRRSTSRITALSIVAGGECLSFRIQDHGIGIAFVGLASLLGRPRSTHGPSKVPSKASNLGRF